MRMSALRTVLCLCVASALAGCNQDSYSSNPVDRETHMGDIHAAPPPPPPAAPTPMAPAPAPAAPAPSGS